ncbi:MAG: hypothetical protein ACRCWY_13970 [Cellulosilyticaceae bacterium]
MTAKKRRLGNLTLSFEEDGLPLSLDKLLGSTTDAPSPEAPFSLDSEVSLERLANDLGVPTSESSMDAFIEAYSAPTYTSLDDLLEASLSSTQLNQAFLAPPSSSTSLFDGLGDLLDE